uniref:Flocculation protein FLO11-like n=1 Tax=Labrus bergylta TaxID=56723 RepID=A0A3Q3GM66_9LABR|nr:flocculation protein FLO11-like [Labrus bergylta]
MEYHSGGSLPLLGRPRYCPGANANGGYLCETGHCCGETGCCTYYYELWWFWLLWTVLILFSCCCAYRHRRAKLRVQQQQRQREISLLAYHGANSYPSSMLDLSFLASLKLPSYEEVAAQPSTPPPPYSSVFTTPRYPQPPRTSDPHLLTQHGPLLHQTLSDGPSSFSSDNSSSCSCDSCCPSSPCSSSLSAPVTYETDTSHATTPSEAAPLTLDVTMETIAAAANRLEVNRTRFESERTATTVDIDMGDEVSSGAQESIATDSSVPNQTVTVALVNKAVPPHPLPSPGAEVALPVETSSPLKLDLAPCPPTVSKCSSSTLPSPSVDTTLTSNQTISIVNLTNCLQTSHSPITTSMTDCSTPTACNSDISSVTQTLKTLDLTRTFDTANIPSSPTSVPSPDFERMLAAMAVSPGLSIEDPNPSFVPIPASPNFTQAKAPEPSNHTQPSSPVPRHHIQASGPMSAILTQAPDSVPSHLITDPDPLTSNLSEVPVPIITNLTQKSVPVTTNLRQATDAIPTNFTQDTNLVPTIHAPPSNQVLTAVTQASDKVPSKPSLVPNIQLKIPKVLDCEPNPILAPNHAQPNPILATDAAPTSLSLTHNQISEPSHGSDQVLGITRLRSNLPQHPGPVAVLVSCQDQTTVPANSGPSLVLPLSSGSDLICHSPLSVQTGLRTGTGSCGSDVGSISSPLSTHSPVLSFTTQAASSSSCPAITIEADVSFAPCQSPPTVLYPSSPSPPSLPSPPCLPSALCPTSPPAPALLLDPLTALHQSNKGGSSSGHASSLSPSPRATQSPPKQTLFSPCVDIFEPEPSWEDGEEDQDQKDNDDEDEDIGADESQYRHRRLTGDSGIEVCRCRMEDEEEEEEEKGEGMEDDSRGGVERDKKGGGNTDLHDSVDCPARSQITTEEGLLCNSTSTTTSTSEDCGKAVVVMETV